MGTKPNFFINNIRRIVLSLVTVLVIARIAFFHGKSHSAPTSNRTERQDQTQESAPSSNDPSIFNKPIKIVKTEPSHGEILHFIGILTPGKFATLTVLQPAKVVNILTTPGSEVMKNATLIDLNNTIQTAQVSETADGIVASEAQLQKAEEGAVAKRFNMDQQINNAKNGLTLAKLKLNEAETGKDAALSQQQANVTAARQDIVKCRIALLTARRNLRSVTALSAIGGASKDDLNGARAEVASATSDLVVAKSQLNVLLPSHGLPPAVSDADSKLQEAMEGEKEAQESVSSAMAGAKTEQLISEADVHAARASLLQAESANLSSKSSASLNDLRSPFPGIVANIHVHSGEIAQPGQPLITIVSLRKAYVSALIPVKDIARLKLNEKVQLKFSADPDNNVRGLISWISPVVNSDGRSVPIHITYSKLTHPLLLNQFVDIEVP